LEVVGARGKDSKFIFLFLQNGIIVVTGVYLGVVGQYPDFLGYGFDYLLKSLW
jgi:hypothetical protein